MAKFEVVSRFADAGIALPVRKTQDSAGYDLAAAEDIILPSAFSLLEKLKEEGEIFAEKGNLYTRLDDYLTLEELAQLTKVTKAKPSLVSTGLKCELDPGTYLELSVRSSTPLKYWIIMANGVGIIDRDYYNNPGNEGEIFFQLINFCPYPILIQKGECLGQGIIKNYGITEKDVAAGTRVGGFGSTSK